MVFNPSVPLFRVPLIEQLGFPEFSAFTQIRDSLNPGFTFLK